MEMCWKFLIPLSLLGLLIAAVFRLVPSLGQIFGFIGLAVLLIAVLWAVFRPTPRPSGSASR
jgi:membrane protein implicated in regulation of membrane protease activity